MVSFFEEIRYSSVSGQQHFEQMKNSLTVQLRGQSVETILLNEVIEPGPQMAGLRDILVLRETTSLSK